MWFQAGHLTSLAHFLICKTREIWISWEWLRSCIGIFASCQLGLGGAQIELTNHTYKKLKGALQAAGLTCKVCQELMFPPP